MIDGSEKRYRQLAFELHNSHVCEKRSKLCILHWIAFRADTKCESVRDQRGAGSLSALEKSRRNSL